MFTAAMIKIHIRVFSCPCHYLPGAIGVFHQRGAALDPVTVVHVAYAIDVADLRGVDVSADHAIIAFFPAVGGQGAFKLKNKIHSALDSILEISAEAPVAKPQSVPDPVVAAVQHQHEIIGTVSQETQPRCQARDAIKHVSVRDEISEAICTAMFGMVHDGDASKSHAQRYHGSQEFIVIARDVGHCGSAAGHGEYPAYDIGVALAPAQPVLLCLPTINDVTHEIEMITGMVFEEIIELAGLAIARAQMHVTDEDTAVMLRHSII